MSRRSLLVLILALLFVPSIARGQQNGNVYRWNGNEWVQVQGAVGTRISVGPDGSPWVVNARNEIYRSVNGAFERLPGAATDIGVGGDGSAWIIGTDAAVYRWNGQAWDRTSGSGIAISVDRTGAPWVVNGSEEIFQWVDGRFVRHVGGARDIGAGNGVWVVGTDNVIYELVNNEWVPRGGTGVRISAGPAGSAWVVNQAGGIYRWDGQAFRTLPGGATDISVNVNGDAWVIGTPLSASPRPRRR